MKEYVTKSSGNVFADLGFHEEEAAILKMRADLMNDLRKFITEKKLSQVEAIFEEENKHIFNEFGITLRKTKMYDEALANYMKALEISPQDENLYFNIARLYYDKEDGSKAQEWLDKALNINPDFREARQFKDVLAAAAKKAKTGPTKSPEE